MRVRSSPCRAVVGLDTARGISLTHAEHGTMNDGGRLSDAARTAAELAAPVPRARPDERAGDVRTRLVGAALTGATDVAVCEGDRYLGVAPIERVLAAEATAEVRTLSEHVPALPAAADREAAAAAAARAGARTVAVVGPDERLLGLIPSARLISVLAEEHEEDLARIGGFLAATSRARTAAEEPLGRRLWHRFPWLALGLVGAMASAGLVGSYEGALRSELLLAFFVPAVVYMADAVGTQTEAVVIRGMSLGVSLRRVAARELATGLLMGALVGGAFLPFALLVWGNARLAGVVALALFVSCSLATLVAMALPYALARLGRDPAFGSGPLATVVQDLLSILVYFAIAGALLG